LLVQRVCEESWTVAEAAKAAGISERSAYKWLGRYRKHGPAGLDDRRSAPTRVSRRTARARVRETLRLRRQRFTSWEIAERTGLPRSTVSAILRRHGLNRLSNLDPKPPVRRYEKSRPGQLVHLDIKPLGKIRGVGHRIHGDRRRQARGVGWEYAHVAIDDATRLSFVEVNADQLGATAVEFLKRAVDWYRSHGIEVERVLTDNGSCYRSRVFCRACEHLGIKHTYTRPYRPQTNGKAERFIQTLIRSWAYGCAYSNSAKRTQALPAWVHHYNYERPHGGLNRITPWERFQILHEQRH
jgi:transposase InsO family protein